MPRRASLVIASLLAGLFASAAVPQENRSAALVGIWEAVRTFADEVHGTLLLVERQGRLVADIAGFVVPVLVRDGHYSFELPDKKGSFRGQRKGEEIQGFWMQPPTATSNTLYSSSVTLRKDGSLWRGEVKPFFDRFTYYFPVTQAADGSLATYLRNPERNDGVFNVVNSIAIDGDKLRFTGKRRGSNEPETRFEARWADGRIVDFPGRGGSYEFRRIDGDTANAFYPRGNPPSAYRYEKPLQRDDGWKTASVDDVDMDRAAIEGVVRRIIETPMNALGSSQIHSLLIARHGKLVVEEYFHGFHRDQPHEMRSASKSFTSLLVGAAMQAGVAISPDTPVYATMLGTVPANLEPRKRAMKLEHLLTMSGGHFCDDSNDDAPGNENTMQEQDKERDWYRFILSLPIDRTPGEKVIY
jgi:hypothetical protein